MTQQTFATGKSPHIILHDVQGNIRIHGQDEHTVTLMTGDNTNVLQQVQQVQQEGNMLRIGQYEGDIELYVPKRASIQAGQINGGLSIERVRDVRLEGVAGEIALDNIGGDTRMDHVGAVHVLTNISGDLTVFDAPMIHVQRSVGGDAALEGVAQIEIGTAGAELAITNAETVTIGRVGADLHAENILVALHCGAVGADCQIAGSTHAAIVTGNIGGDIEVSGAASLVTRHIGADCKVRDIYGDVKIGAVGADAMLQGIGGNLEIATVGGDATVKGVQGTFEVGSVGGDLRLQAAFPPHNRSFLKAGGDVMMVLPENPNLSISAKVGGDIRGQSLVSNWRGNIMQLVYGDGSAQVKVHAGGDLLLQGGGNPRTSNSMGSMGSSWNDFGREMSNFGYDMGNMGEEIGREISAAFQEAGWSQGDVDMDLDLDIDSDMRRKAEKQARKAQQKAEEQARKAQRQGEEQARKAQRYAEEQARRAQWAGEQARRASEQAERMNIRINNREWRLDPERLGRLKEQAQRAASEGIFGAIDAVEQALRNLGMEMPVPPTAPTPPTQPTAPSAPVQPVPPTFPSGPTPSMPSTFESQETQEQSEQVSNQEGETPTAEEEREAILRMIAEGRITPDEGDLLLEALGS